MAMQQRSKKEKRLSKTIVVGPFRMAFPALFEPEETDNGERYKVTCLFPPDSKSIRLIEDTMQEVMEDAFGPESDWPSGKKDILPEDKFYDAGTKQYQGFKKGWMALGVSSQDAPGIIDADKNDVLSKREVYGGRWARAQINVTTFDNKAKGVTAYLNHVQLLEHDEAFSGRGSAGDAFDEYQLKDRPRSSDRDEGRDRRSREDDDERRHSPRSPRRDADERSGRDRDEEAPRRGRDEDERDERPRRSRDEESPPRRDARDSRRPRDDDEPAERSPRRGSDKDRDRDDDRDERRPRRARGDDEWN